MNIDKSIDHKLVIVTGANGAIGKAIVHQLAEKDYEVIMVCRDLSKAQEAKKEIIHKIPEAKIRIEIADLSRQSEIKSLAARVNKPVFALVNNAASTPKKRTETPEGIEEQFAANVLNYFWMSHAFHEHLEKSSNSRIVNVASCWAGDLDPDDLEFKKRQYDNNIAYRQSKQANRMLTVSFAEKFKQNGIMVNACHPGEVNSKLSNSLGFGGSQSPDRGAETPVLLATTKEQNSGKWYVSMKEQSCQFSKNKTAIEQLYEICMKYSKRS